MTDYPTIRIKCDPSDMILAGRTARHALANYKVGQDGILRFDVPYALRSFHVKRTKTGVTVRQTEGRAV